MALTLSRVEPIAPHEAIKIWRRRYDLSQEQAAQILGTTRDIYQLWERGTVQGPDPGITDYKPHELCFILRKRYKQFTGGQIADSIGVSRQWVSQMERGAVSPERLVAYWDLHAPPSRR